jgi:hypothetical protein
MIGLSVLIFLINVLYTHIKDVRCVWDPWGGAKPIEWKLWEEGRVKLGMGLISDHDPEPLAVTEARRAHEEADA